MKIGRRSFIEQDGIGASNEAVGARPPPRYCGPAPRPALREINGAAGREAMGAAEGRAFARVFGFEPLPPALLATMIGLLLAYSR